MRASLCILLLLPFALGAQKSDDSPATTLPARDIYGHRVAVPSAVAARRSSPILLDGRLNDAAWQAAQPITDFKQIDPEEGRPGSQRTEVRFLYDDDALYIGAKMYDTEGARGVTTRLVRRDD